MHNKENRRRQRGKIRDRIESPDREEVVTTLRKRSSNEGGPDTITGRTFGDNGDENGSFREWSGQDYRVNETVEGVIRRPCPRDNTLERKSDSRYRDLFPRSERVVGRPPGHDWSLSGSLGPHYGKRTNRQPFTHPTYHGQSHDFWTRNER